jgi:hypothetical protein
VRIKPTRRASWSTKELSSSLKMMSRAAIDFLTVTGKDRTRRCLRDHRTCRMPFRHRARIARIVRRAVGGISRPPLTGRGSVWPRCARGRSHPVGARRIRLGDIALRSVLRIPRHFLRG